VNITGQVQIELFHGDDLGVATPGSPTFDAKCRSLGWLANAGDYALTEMRAKRLAEADCGGGFAFTRSDGTKGVEPGRYHVWIAPDSISGLRGEFSL
jgi:hypothetical protein